MMEEQARARRTPFTGRDGRAVIVRVVMRRGPLASWRVIVRPERAEDPDAEPGARTARRRLLNRSQEIEHG
jgi:hypothetical protein